MINREEIFAKCGGRCAYCGCEITVKNFQVDHVLPKSRAHFERELDNDRTDNLLPTCRKCNNFKGPYRLEEYRRELSLQVTRLRKNAQFDRALRFGQVSINESPIVFHFEKCQHQAAESRPQPLTPAGVPETQLSKE